MENKEYIESVKLSTNGNLIILDQTLLPNQCKYLELDNVEDIWQAIFKLQVRGAPAIGIAAGYGLYVGIKDYEDALTFEEHFNKVSDYLNSSRPTAVNLSWALKEIAKSYDVEDDLKTKKNKILAMAHQIKVDDMLICQKIGEYGYTLLKDNMNILTHCNAGNIATARYGTALAPIYLAKQNNLNIKVYVDETRPLLQGARLTAWELMAHDVDATLICDNMASIVMKEKGIDAIFVGCDRVALNGDTANKIGTSGVAIIAKYYNVPFYVCAPLSTIDPTCHSGNDIEIELRDGSEITTNFYQEMMAPENIKTYNPAFDVTDHSLITAIITEKGIIYPPFNDNLKKLFNI